MSVSLPQFIDSLSSSGLLTSAEARVCGDVLIEGRAARGSVELARELVRTGRLTRFQAKALLAGATRGLTLGSYVLLDRIGAGGMGQVFRAQHRRMKRVVALKILPAKAM